MELIFHLDAIRDAARRFLAETKGKTVFAFHGEMGAGKTTFIHAICDEKGIRDIVSSPTFSIINEYRPEDAKNGEKIFHIDLYRMKDQEEAMLAGVEDCLYSGAICFVEWPEKAPGIFPPDTEHIYITLAGSETRKLRIGRN
ncbi:MAG: tRNA (adenosine(37)-N6)-threonylcarbamoyltransferase complex ATPase subunit type 1 TsaE [Terrimonas sp.]|nr:tRNA (adenosine(37)-N6)-threonylcarbamoyltransferase complex ATPase subunit type 1 TsaE [Terrimonas sp.]